MANQLQESHKERILEMIQQEVKNNFEDLGIETDEDLKNLSVDKLLYIRF